MKRSLSPFSILVLTYLFLATMCQAQNTKKRFGFKLTVGYGSMAVGDINAVLESQEKFFALFPEKEGGHKELNGGFEYEAEFIIDITEHFGLGIGAGYIMREGQSEARVSFVGSSQKPKISAIPIKITAYYSTPIASRLNLYLSGGVGYYIGKIDYYTRWEWYEDSFLYIQAENEIEAKDYTFGFHGGIGFEYSAIKNLAIFIEGTARYAKLNDWKGDQIIKYFGEYWGKDTGILWYNETVSPRHESRPEYSFLEIQEKKRTTSTIIKYVRKAEEDFSGFSLRAGIKIKF